MKKLLIILLLSLFSFAGFSQKSYTSDSLLIMNHGINTNVKTKSIIKFYSIKDSNYIDITSYDNTAKLKIVKRISSEIIDADSCTMYTYIVESEGKKPLVLYILSTVKNEILGLGISSKDYSVVFKINLDK